MYKMRYAVGIDIGTRTSKAVVIGGDAQVIGRHLIHSGYDYRSAAIRLRDELLRSAEISDRDSCIAVTGLGSKNVPFSHTTIGDILCCSKGMFSHFPQVRTIIDIQRTYTQVIRTDDNGKIKNYAINEKCATGCGCFLEIISNVLRIDSDEWWPIALDSQCPVSFTTGCAVFGESEVISRVSEGYAKEDIISGVLEAIATKIVMLLDRIGIEPECSVCGGGALNIGLIRCIEKKLDSELLIPPKPEYINALGAALSLRIN
jgi:predicted CoA-substrate-specific enzyme activase